jgi:hypothetical protein
LILEIIKLIINNFSGSILKNTAQAITFIKFLLLSNEDDIENEESIETLSMALGILSTILCGSIPIKSKEEEQMLQDLQSILMRLSNHADPQISEMASTATLSIEAKQYVLNQENDVDIFKIKIKGILEDLRNSILPVRTHGIMNLRKLVLDSKKNNFDMILKNIDKIYNIFESQLNDEDSFLYYSAILGLSSLGILFVFM